MKTIRAILPFLTIAWLGTPSAGADQLLYLASQNDKSITAYRVDEQTGELSKKFAIELPGNPGPMAFSPDTSFVYAAMTGLADVTAGVATLRRAADGSLKLLDTAAITSRAPYIRADKRGGLLLAAHYGEGDVTVYRIANGVCTGELLDQKKTDLTAHCIEIDPSGRFVFVPHTAPNKVYQFVLDQKSGKLTPNDPPYVDGPDEDHAYHQPRHYAHHPKQDIAYTSNERGGGITAWKFDSAKGTLAMLQTLSTLPPDYDGSSAAADIQLTPDGRFAYVSNRDVTQRGEDEAMQDTLAGFALDPETGRMKSIGHFPTVHFPRSFSIDLTGRFLYAAGERSASLAAYRIDGESGKLERIADYKTGEGPIWVMCGDVSP